MAQMPRGEPRSVPDPAGEKYDEMLQQERLKRAIADAAAAEPSPFLVGPEYPSLDPLLDVLKQSPRRQAPPIAVDDGEIDPRCVVQDPSPRLSPSELAAQRQALERVSFMADHPLAGAAYGLAALAGASPRARDGALMAGGFVDTAMLGAAPYGARTPRQMTPPRIAPAVPSLPRPNIRYGDLNGLGQASGMTATLTEPMIGSGTRAYWRRTPPGWQGHGGDYNEARAHLLARQLGGSGSEMQNLVTLTQRGANTPQMESFENSVARRVAGGEVVEYSAKPIYDSGVLPPSGVLVTAHGTRGAPSALHSQSCRARPMTIEALIRAMPPPIEPSGVFLGPWEPVEAELGTTLPQDYKDLVRVYGSGYYMEFFGIKVPRSPNLNIRLEAQVPLTCEALADYDEQPYPLWPKLGGLLPFGGTDNGDELFWLPSGAPANWGVVVWDRGFWDFQAFDCDLTGFLAGLATGEIRPKAFPEDLLDCDCLFRPHTAGDLSWPPVRP